MKVEQLIVQYLYKNKSVSIQDIGRFTIAPEFAIPMEGDKDQSLPDGAIQFEYDKKTLEDEGLVNYIVEHTGKIKPLASSDLESYSILSRQFLNIGKPLPIEGLGVLQKNQQGSIDFYQGNHMATRQEMVAPVMKEKVQDDISFSAPPKQSSSKSGWMILLLVLFLLSAIGAAYYYFTRQKDAPVQQTDSSTASTDSLTDTSNIASLGDTSLSRRPDTTSTLPAPAADGYSFKIVLKEYNSKSAADKAYKKLSDYGHTLLLVPVDSTNFKIMMPFSTPLTDTTRAKDSLKRFFGGKPYVQL
jgi:hypothetical protein